MDFRRFAIVFVRAVAVLIVFVVGCSSSGSGSSESSGPPPATPPPPPPAPPADVTPAGVLRVRIAGVPNGSDAEVTVTGPNHYLRGVKSDVDLLVPPGAYAVNAGAIGGEKGAPLVVPSVAEQSVVVAAAAGATVDVDYAEIETKLKPDVRQVDKAALGSLTSVTRNPAGGGTLVFGAANATTQSWRVGDVIVLPAAPTLPLGFLGRVTANAGGTTITAGPATLEDVYAQGGFHFTRHLSGHDLVRAPGISSGICSPLSHSFPFAAGPASVALDVGGKVCITPTISLSIWVDIRGFHAHFDVQTTTTLTLTGAATAALSVSADYLVAGPFPFAAIDFGPIWLTPVIEFRAFADVGVDAGLSAGMTVTSSTDAGFNLDNTSVNSWNQATSSFEPIWPTPFAGAHATLRAGPQLDILVNGIAGPEVGVRGVFDFELDALKTPRWKLDAGVDVDVGFAANAFFAGGATIAVPVWSERTTLATSDSIPTPGVTTGAAGVPGGQGIAVGPDDTIYMASGDTVKAIKKSGSILWSYAGDPDMWSVARDADGTVYATSFAGSVFAINPDGTQKWKVPAQSPRGLAIGDSYVYTTTFGTTAALVGFSKATGAAWTPLAGKTGVPLPGGNWGVSVAKNGTIYALADGLMAIDPATGTTLWNNNVGGSGSHPPAIGDDGAIYQVDRNGAVVATDPNGTNKWTSGGFLQAAYGGLAIGPNGNVYYCALNHVRGVSPTGALVFWVKHPGVTPFCRSAPTIGQDGSVFVTTTDGFFAYAADGTLNWSKPWPEDDTASSPAFLSTNDVVVAARSGLRSYASGTLLGSTWGREAGGNASTGRKP